MTERRPPYCLDPRPLCWGCGNMEELMVLDGVGWLCLDCSEQEAATDGEQVTPKDGT
jgi:hypothetical protein